MKKILTVLLIVIALVFVSCNADQPLGIFAEVAASQPVAGIKILRYLGSYGNANYILADDGIYKGTELIFENSPKNGFVSSAYLKDGTISVLTNEGKAGKLENNKITLTEPQTSKYVYLTLSNGKYIEEGPSSVLETDGYLLLSYITNQGFVCYISSQDGTIPETHTVVLPSRPVGFQPVDTNKFIILTSSNNFYSVTKGTSPVEPEELGSSTAFTSQSVTQVPSFAKEGKAYFKAPSTFVEVPETYGNFILSNKASDLATATITNIVKVDDGGWIAATRKSGLYKIDKDTLEATPIEF